MKNKKLMNTVIALSALALIGGGIIASQAASDNMFEARNGKAMRGEARGFQNLSEEEKIVMEAQRESRQAEMQADFEAVAAALAANDYNAWQDAIGENNPFAEKVTADNFTKFVEAHNLMNDAREILKSIGIEEGPAMGFGARQGNGQGNGQGMGMRHGNAQGGQMMKNCPNPVNVETEIK